MSCNFGKSDSPNWVARRCVAWLFGISERRVERERSRCRSILLNYPAVQRRPPDFSVGGRFAPPPGWPLLGHSDEDGHIRPQAGAWFLLDRLTSEWTQTLRQQADAADVPQLSASGLDLDLLQSFHAKTESLRRKLIERVGSRLKEKGDGGLRPDALRVFLTLLGE